MTSDTHPSSSSVVVGVDGSRAAVAAALWAVDEAVDRDIPLRLVYAIEPGNADDPQQGAHRLATAELAVRYAFTAVESTAKLVKIELEILHGRPVATLVRASRSAAMVCVGAVGFKHAAVGGVGSTAATLAASAHCPVAIIRGYDHAQAKPGVVVAEIDETPSSAAILERGAAEALLRGAQLRVLTTWQSRFTDVHDTKAVSKGNRTAKANLERRLGLWRLRHPELDIQPVAAHCTTLDYLVRNAEDVQLVVVGRGRARGLTDIVGHDVEAALHGTQCSLLVCQPHSAL